MGPEAAIIVASLIQAAAQAGGSAYGASRQKKAAKKAEKLDVKEAKRETYADLLDQANTRSTDLASKRIASRGRRGRSKSKHMMDTAANFREALKV